MISERRAFRAFEDHLAEEIGVDEAATVVGHRERQVTQADLDALADQLTDRLSSLWRRDLLLIITGQFVALAGVLTAVM